MNTIVINGKTIVTTEEDISYIDGEFFVGDKKLVDTPEILERSTIIINGDVDTIKVKSVDLEVNGNVNGDIYSTGGDVKITGGRLENNNHVWWYILILIAALL